MRYGKWDQAEWVVALKWGVWAKQWTDMWHDAHVTLRLVADRVEGRRQ